MGFGFSKETIAQLKEAGKVGNARVYQTMLNSITTFLKKEDIPLRRITHKWLKSYEALYLGKGNSHNGLAVHLRTLRALYNRAIKEYPKLRESYPFQKYTIKHQKTRKRAISEDAIQKLKDTLPQGKRQEKAKDYFFMSFYLMGLRLLTLRF